HHLSSVLLHTANSILLFLVLKLMTRETWPSVAVAALFAWHPLHVESVAWVAERKDVLSGLFWMLTLWAYVKYVDALRGPPNRGSRSENGLRSRWFYILALVFFALGLMSKPMLVTLPFVLLLLDYWPLQRLARAGSPLRVLAEKLPFLALSAGCSFITVLAQRQGQTIVSAAALPVSRRIAHAILAYAHYSEAMFVPRNLAVAYSYSPSNSWPQILGAAAMLVVISLVVLVRV